MSKPYVDHIGVLVPDMDKGIAMFAKIFNMEPDAVIERPDVGVRVAMFKTANVTIELLQYTDDPGAAFARKTMGDRVGINHVCFAVEDADAAIREIEDSGIPMMEGFPIQGAHGKVAFFEAEQSEGFLFEVCQPDEDSAFAEHA